MRHHLVFGLAAAIVGATVSAVPATAQEQDDQACSFSTSELQERSESAATALAAECGSQVLIRDSIDYTTKSYAQPDGSVATEFHAEPQWVPDDSGEWVDADPTLEVDEDGTVTAKATVSELEFAAEGESEFATATNRDGESVSLSWPEPLPKPVLDGATAIYPEVMPEVDLEVYAGVDNFSYALVVKTPEAAQNPNLERVEVGFAAAGLEVAADRAADNASISDRSGDPAFTVERPWMWDSSDNGDGTPDRASPMDLEINGDTLAVIPERDLLDDPEAEYPIYIDPKFRDEGANFANAWSQGTGITCGSGSEMCTGRQTWKYDGAYGHWRSAMKFNGLQAIADRDIQQATVWITQTHTGDAGGPNQTVQLYAMDWFNMNDDISWSAFDDKLVGKVAADSVPTSNTDAGESDQRIEWADDRTANRIQNLVDNGNNTAVFAAISGANSDQEENQDYWRKLDPSSAKLVVWHAPVKPTKLYTDGQSCSTSAPGTTINTLTPTLKLKAPIELEPNNRVSFYVYERDKSHPSALQQIDANDVADGATLTVSIDSGKLSRGKTYRWNARAWDSDGDSARYGDFTSYCYFTVNSLPETPTDLSTEGIGCGTKSDPTLVTTGTPKLSAVPHDPDGGTVWARYRFYEETGDNIKQWSVQSQDGVAAPTRISSDLVSADGLYRWRVITDDALTSALNWSSYCWLEVDTTAPEPPDIVQVTTQPVPGDPVEFEFVGGDDVTGFEYALEGETKQTVSAADGRTKVAVTPSTASVDHALQVWAVDAAGNTSSPTTHWFTTIETRPAEAIGAWRLDDDLLDDAADATLSSGATPTFGPDRVGRSEAAVVFDGTGESCLTADRPIVDSTQSYTIAGWAYVDAADPDHSTAVVDVTGERRSNLKLALSSSGRWSAAMYSADAEETTTLAVMADESVTEYGVWTHVAAVYDAAAERLRVYVNGALEASKPVSFEPWAATGIFSVGCGAWNDGGTFNEFTGSVDDAVAFQQVLTSDAIEELMAGKGLPTALQAWYPLRGDAADHSGRGTDLTAMPAAPAWVTDQYGRSESALGFDGSTCPTAGTAPVRTDSSFTVAAWARLDADHANLHTRLFSFNGSSSFSVMTKYNSEKEQWELSVTESDTTDPVWGNGAWSVDAPSEEQWTHIAVTVDPDNNRLEMFINGDLSGTGPIAADWGTWRADEFVIGCSGTTDGSRSNQWDGAITDVRIWRGAMEADEVAAAHVEQLSSWELGQDEQGVDQWDSNDLTLNGDYDWEVDRWNECWAAYGLSLDGAGWAETAGPVITTDESFTVAAWARIDDIDDFRTVVSQTGGDYGAFNLNYSPAEGRFQLSMPQGSDGVGWARVTAQDPPAIDDDTGLGQWYHLVGQVDLGAGVIRLFVDGELQGEAPVVDSPWQATGPLTIGAAEQLGSMTNQMVGGIDQVKTWSGALDELAIAALAADRPAFEQDPDNANCSGDDEPPPTDL
ncbi:LamG domain-containing protein [Glycomyces sp. L485]|uniref:LamG domain-containing protein n=1 Tax=Glycomyces sp. L485 TaxID=2909235 RepID=UPI001F4A32D5|nr:LamG domain-containing protein [Glycomyces sp. L485]MCH7232625.1 LamG domain-containing protein [Glycomyces sp. L485]